LNISATQSIPSPVTERSREAGDAASPDPTGAEQRRNELVEEVTAELTSWNPREFIFAFRRMHQGALSLIHLNVLTLLELEGPLAMGRLADQLDVSVASATGIVSRMESRGLVERGRDDRDRRIVLVHATQEAADVFRGMDENRKAGLERLLIHLTVDELAGLLAGHRALRAARAAHVRDQECRHGEATRPDEDPAQ
jgi:DNA-binding MarR family transcriptional regulator